MLNRFDGLVTSWELIIQHQITVLDIPPNTVHYIKIYKSSFESRVLLVLIKTGDCDVPRCLGILVQAHMNKNIIWVLSEAFYFLIALAVHVLLTSTEEENVSEHPLPAQKAKKSSGRFCKNNGKITILSSEPEFISMEIWTQEKKKKKKYTEAVFAHWNLHIIPKNIKVFYEL